MTAVEIAQIHWTHGLPRLASDPRVHVVTDLQAELESCEQCVQKVYLENQPDTTPVPVGKVRVTYRFRDGGSEHRTDLCGPECTDIELEELFNVIEARDITLHVPTPYHLPGGPQGPAQSPPAFVGDDEVFNLLDSLRLFIKDDMPNTATVDMSGRDGFTHAANTLLAHISQLGIQRIQDLESSAAA